MLIACERQSDNRASRMRVGLRRAVALKDALLHSAIAEECDRHRTRTGTSECKSGTVHGRYSTTDDGVCAEVTEPALSPRTNNSPTRSSKERIRRMLR